jgi:hypothetical protein
VARTATLGCFVNEALSPQVPGEGLRAAEDRGFEPRRVVTPNRISSSGHNGPDPFMLDQRIRSVLRAPYRTALDCNPNCNLTDPRLPANDSARPWSSSPSPDLFPATWPRPVVAQASPPNPIAAEPDGRRVLSRGGAADHAVTPQAPLTGSGCREYSNGGFGGGHPHFPLHAPDHQIRRSGHILRGRPLRSLSWADIPQLSAWDAPCPAAWQQCWLQSRRPGADPRPSQASHDACARLPLECAP